MPKPLFILPPTISATDFLPEVEARKVAGVRLVSPPGAWSDEILQTLMRDHSYLPYDRLVVNFKQRDDAMGYAVGYVSIIDAPKVSIPVIIVSRELKPLDLLIVRSSQDADETTVQEGAGSMTDDRVLPLTEQNFNSALEAGDIGTVMPPNEVRGTGFTEDGSGMRLPMRGRTVLASVLGATEAQKEKFASILSASKEACAGFHIHGHDEIVNAWLNAPEPKKGFENKIASLQVEQAEARIVDTLPEELTPAKFAAAVVYLADGSAKTAMAFSGISLHNPDAGLADWLAFEDGSYCKTAATVLGTQLPDDHAAPILEKLAANSIRRGSDIVFITDAAITAPVKVAAIQVDDANGNLHIGVVDGLGTAAKVLLTRGIKEASFDGTTWVFPLSTRVLQLGKYAEELKQPISANKLASIIRNTVPDTLAAVDGQYSLSVRGQPFGFQQASKAAAAEVLNRWFSNGEELMKLAEKHRVLHFDGRLDKTVARVEALKTAAAQLPQKAAAAVKEIAIPLDLAVKLAAAIGRPDCADAVLGTGFLNEDNLADFMQLEGQFDQTVEGLARLLLAIRMGLPGDENATAVAMKALQRVTERLQSANQEVSSSGY